MVDLIKHLSDQVPIVRPDGTPTPYFARLLETIADAKIAASVVEAMGGDPGSDQIVTWDESDGDLDFKYLSDVLDFIGSAAHGDILYRDSAGWARLGAGPAGQVLQTNGAGADPTWVNQSGGAFRGCLVRNNAALTGQNTSSGYIIPWANEVYDTSNIHGVSSTVTITIASPGVVTWTGHTFANGEPIVFSTTGALPTGLTAGTTYWIINQAANTFQVSATPGGAAINTSGSQSGTHTGTNNSRLIVPSGVTRVRMGLCIEASNVTAATDCFAQIRKNGSDLTSGGPWVTLDNQSSTLPRFTAHSAVVTVAAGDRFNAVWSTVGDTSSDIGVSSWFSMEVIE